MKTINLLFLIIIFSSAAFAQKQFPFLENKNQWPDQVLFKANIPGGALWLEKTNFIFDISESNPHEHSSNNNQSEEIAKIEIKRHAYKVSFEGANPDVKIKSFSSSSDYCNFFVGNNSSKWTHYAYSYEAVNYNTLYPNIDMKIYSSGFNYKYDFIINKNGDPSNIKMKYEGCNKIEINDGNLVINTSVGKIKELHPLAYQDIKGKRIKVPCNFVINGNIVSFELPDGYNNEQNLVIDPEIVFSTYTGSTTDNWGFTATYDNMGCSYSGGICFNTGYHTSMGAYQESYQGGSTDITIIKYDETGAQRLWATYIGGTTSAEIPHSLVCNNNNDLIIFGTTGSADFPTTINAYDTSFNGGTSLTYDAIVNFTNGIDIFVTKLNADGTILLGSTYVGGSDNDGLNFRTSYAPNLMTGNGALYYNYADGARGEIICDGSGNVFAGSCTFSSNFPTTSGSFNTTFSGNQEGVVFKLNTDLSQLLWSSYFGGSNDDAIYSLDLDYNGDVYIGGGTTSNNIQTTTGVYQQAAAGGSADGFFAHISANGSNLIKSSYFGSTLYDQVSFIRVDNLLNVYITGQTKAPGSTFISNAIYGTPNSGQFIAKFPNNLNTPIWSTVFGTGNGKPNISLSAFGVDQCNRIYISGWGREWANYGESTWAIDGTNNMDITSNAYQSTTDGQDFYLMVLANDASHLEYATFFGELHQNGNTNYCGHDHVDGGTSRFDKNGHLYQSVCASCGNGCNGFPTTSGSWSPNNGSITSTDWVCNNALFSFNFFDDFVNAHLLPVYPDCNPYTVQFQNNNSGNSYFWNFGDGDTSTIYEPVHTYNQPGNYLVTLVVTDSLKCNISDTGAITVQVLSPVIDTLPTINISPGASVQIGIAPDISGLTTYQWIPFNNLSNSFISDPLASPDTTTNYLLVVSHGSCTDSIYQMVLVLPLGINPQLNGINQKEHFFNVFPNPTKEKFIVKIKNTKKSVISFELLNSLGEKILSYPQKEYAAGEWAIEINLNSLKLSSGIYNLKLINENYSEIIKIVIQ